MQTAGSITNTFEVVWNRLQSRLAGLQDNEYFWEPVPECWSLRQQPSGQWLLDGEGGGGPTPTPVPVTTIVWRIGHIGGTVGGFARMKFGDGRRIAASDLNVPPHAADAADFLTVHYQSWLAGLLSLDENEWPRTLGDTFGPFAEANTVDLALHVLDELIHHSAEVGVLRDLWAAGLR